MMSHLKVLQITQKHILLTFSGVLMIIKSSSSFLLTSSIVQLLDFLSSDINLCLLN